MSTMRRIADIHMHVIPGVDDGSTGIGMSLEMIRMASAQGVRTIFCTSHDIAWLNNTKETYRRFDILKSKCAELIPEVQLYRGCELYCNERSIGTILKGLQMDIFPSLNGGKHVLIEFPTWGFTFDSVREICKRIIGQGWKPIMAHTERYHSVIETIDHVTELKEEGCLVQVNAYSIADEQSQSTKELANQLLGGRLVTIQNPLRQDNLSVVCKGGC